MSLEESAESLVAARIDELLDILLDSLDIANELSVSRVLQFTFGLIYGNRNGEYHELSLKLIKKLFALIIPTTCEYEILNIHNAKLVTDVLLCVALWTNNIPEKGKFLLNQLCPRSSNDNSQAEDGQTLAQVMDNFLCELGAECILSHKLFKRIEQLLKSTVSEERRSARLIYEMILDKSLHKSNGQQQLDLFSYIIIMESLEVKASTQKPAPIGIQLSLLKDESNDANWLHILYTKLLQNPNLEERTSTLEFMMAHFTVAELFSAHLLIEFLTATNKPELHNLEGYFLPEEQMKKFVSDIIGKQFVKALAEVEWCGVALHHWLSCLGIKKQPQISKNLLLKICTLVRNFEHLDLRNSACNRICELFEVTIKHLSLGDYMSFIAALFNKSDDVCEFAFYLLSYVIEDCNNINKEMVHLTKSAYEMLCNYQTSNVLHPFRVLLEQLEHVPKSQHGWWRLPAFFCLCWEDHAIDFYRSMYDININVVKECRQPTELHIYLIDKLNCNTEEEILFVQQRSVDLFLTNNVHNWSQLEGFHLNLIEIIRNCTLNTLVHLTNLLGGHDQPLQDAKVLNTLLMVLRTYPKRWTTTGNILKYATQHLDLNETKNLIEDMISNCNDVWELGQILMTKSLPQSTIIKGLLHSDISLGVRRIEHAYLNSLSTWNVSDHIKRENYITYVSRMAKEDLYELFNELLSINESINEKETLLENSIDHRIQMRIARTFFHFEFAGASLPNYWSENLWTALLAPNNQLNIRYFYECLVAKLLPNFELLLEKIDRLASFQPNQQESLISVVHLYCMFNWETLRLEHLQKVFQRLSDELISTNSQTVIFCQLILHRLAIRYENRIDLPIAASMKDRLPLSFKDNPSDYQMQVRLMLPKILQPQYCLPADAILYMTNAPFDEYTSPKFGDWQDMDEIEKCRSKLIVKREIVSVN
ncbi:uncharacterized protein LOC6563011 [Drosophila grimshawi]|uniref:uncharacterized protein LOC6563011 n=1 Tax=Drosophila grimshawi TaxID=7222 RepID=UPI0013EF2131|nr:uncharacterized protein LOC6563011 [Drosophila grimshawi]